MHVSHSMALEDFATQLREIVEAQPFSPQRELTIDLIDQITTPVDGRESEEKAYVAGEVAGAESIRGEMLAIFERDGLNPEIGLTETQHEQILELLGKVKP